MKRSKVMRFALALTILIAMLATFVGVSSSRAAAVCSPASTISVPFAKDGAGDFCYQTTSLCTYINSWNVTSLEVNGTAYTNIYVAASSIVPANGVYTIHYNSAVAWGHFEIAGTCSGGGGPTNTPVRTATPGSGPTLTPVRTSTPGSSTCNIAPVDPNATTQA